MRTRPGLLPVPDIFRALSVHTKPIGAPGTCTKCDRPSYVCSTRAENSSVLDIKVLPLGLSIAYYQWMQSTSLVPREYGQQETENSALC